MKIFSKILLFSFVLLVIEQTLEARMETAIDPLAVYTYKEWKGRIDSWQNKLNAEKDCNRKLEIQGHIINIQEHILKKIERNVEDEFNKELEDWVIIEEPNLDWKRNIAQWKEKFHKESHCHKKFEIQNHIIKINEHIIKLAETRAGEGIEDLID